MLKSIFDTYKLINGNCLIIYKHLLDAFQECDSICAPYKNIVAVFFHDLMQILTGYIFKNIELHQKIILPELAGARYNVFPYIDYEDIRMGFNLEKNFYTLESNKQRSCTYKIARNVLNIGLRKKSIALTTNAGCNKIFDVRYKILHPQLSHIYIENQDKQLSFLIEHLCKSLEAIELTSDIKSLIALTKKHIETHCGLKEEFLSADMLVTGTTCKRQNRFLAAQAHRQNIPVLDVWHGEADGILDEPIIGYGELLYPDYILGYGKVKNWFLNARYTKPLYPIQDHILSNSNIVRRIHTPEKIIKALDSIDNPALMYVPTGFSGLRNYGPFRALPDFHYKHWQEKVCSLFPNVILKWHSKFVLDIKDIKTDGIIEKRRFEKVYQNADVYIFDYCSTAFSIAAATSKPIIYLDLGIRNLTKNAQDAIRKRCIYVDLRQIEEKNIYDAVMEQKNKEFVNEYTCKFCLADHDEKREVTVKKTIKAII